MGNTEGGKSIKAERVSVNDKHENRCDVRSTHRRNEIMINNEKGLKNRGLTYDWTTVGRSSRAREERAVNIRGKDKNNISKMRRSFVDAARPKERIERETSLDIEDMDKANASK